ncbi:MAG TPA: T9SS type A sorting domain-containing protein, partial [Chitinophagaceae bacterium]|nr:T9SS type A sorting domain-containing protein [Chitinophagaceae bacterium]
NNYVLIGNPYPSAISFSSLYSQNSTSINNNYALYIPTNNAGVYTYWDGLTNTFTGGVGYDDITGNNIATAQAVFVQSAVAGNIVLHFSENIKTEENATAYFKNNSVKEKIKINYLNSSGNKIDETVVRFISDNAVTNNEVGRLDIPSINTGTFIATIKNNTQLAVHSRALNNLISDEVWLNIGATQTGNYTLHFSDYQTLEDADIFLEDHYLNTKQNIKLNDNYSFSVDVNNAATKGSARFSLVFIRTAPSEVVYNQIKMYPNPADKQVSLLLPKGIDNGINYQIKLTDITGKIVIQRKAKGGKEVIDIASLTAGIYIVEITDSKGKRVTEKLVKN